MRHLIVAVCLLLSAPALAQEGHPLSGTWSGERTSGSNKTRVTLVMEWNGTDVTGTINPGPDALPLDRVTVDYETWTVRIQAKGVVIDGKLNDLGSWHRTLTGTWTAGGAKDAITFRRD